MAPIVYTSSIGMYGADDADSAHRPAGRGRDGPPAQSLRRLQARERGHRPGLLGSTTGCPSVGLRPMTVYGVGRDQGMTSSPTKAIAAALLGMPVPDRVRRLDALPVRRGRRADADRSRAAAGSTARASSTSAAAVASMTELDRRRSRTLVPEARGLITLDPTPLPFPADIDHDGLAGARAGTGDAVSRRHRRDSADIYRDLAAPGPPRSPPNKASSRLHTRGHTHDAVVGWRSGLPVYADPDRRSRRPGPPPPDLDGGARRVPSAPRPTSPPTSPRSSSRRTGAGSRRTAPPACRTTSRWSRRA